MLYLRADTSTEVTVGPAVAVGDGYTPVTGLTISGADEAELIKHGATTTTAIAGTLSAITGADGYYALDLSTSDTDTEGRLVLAINDDSLILPIRHEFTVVNANVYDALFAAAGTDYLQVDLTEIVGGTVPTPTTTGVPDVNVERWADALVNALIAGRVDANAQVVGDKTGYSLTQTFPANFADLSISATTGRVDVGSWVGTAVNALVSGRVDASVGAMAANVITAAAINAAAITSAKFAAGAIDANAIGADAITAAKIADAAIDAATFAANAITSTVIADNAITAAKIATAAITAAKFGTGAVDAAALATDAVAEIVDGVWDEARSGHTTQGTYGENNYAIRSGDVDTSNFTPTTTQFESTDFTETATDFHKDRTVIFVSGSLTGQARACTASTYSATPSRTKFTVDALTAAPANTDRFILV